MLEYDEENRVPYSSTKGAFEDQFTRSAVREQINALSEIERANLIDEMQFTNDDKLQMIQDFRDSIDDGEELEIRPLIALSPDEFASTLVRFVSRSPDNVVLKSGDFQKIRKFCLTPLPFSSLHLGKETYLIKQYDVLILGKNYDEIAYSYVLEKPSVLDTPDFFLDFSMGAEDRGITAEDYPLTIRTATTSDNFVVHNYLEPVHLLFSTWKMPVRLRGLWPIFINKNGKVIYVPRYRRAFREYHTSILRMHVQDDER